ncbi:MAG: hypothetical protein V4722_05055 [Bacteroidota bacterium]
MNRCIRPLSFLVLLSAVLLGCSKELSVENLNPGTNGGTSVFTLSGAPGNCATPAINGVYKAGTLLGAANTVELTVDVTTIGTYSITTATVNGVSFSGSGTFTATGSNLVVLTGKGTPTAAGAFDYTPGATGCTFTITYTANVPGAVFTLNCATPVVGGTYTVGTPLTSANTVTLTANVTTAGTYTITTTPAPGFTFTASGTFIAGSNQPIIFVGSGTPTTPGVSTFTPITGGCTFSITVQPAAPPAVFTMSGAPGACTAAMVSGTYTAGGVLNATHTSIVQVNVTTVGSYTLSTNTVNGIKFSASGVFAATGIQNVTLQGSGTPTAAGTTTLTPQIGTSSCTFPVTIGAATSPCSGLVDGRFSIVGRFTINGLGFGVSLGSQYQISIQDNFIKMDIFFPGSMPPAPGIYNVGTVSISCPDAGFLTNGITWDATAGKVYVSVDGTGSLVVEYCGVTFKGTSFFGGTPINGTGEAKVVL